MKCRYTQRKELLTHIINTIEKLDTKELKELCEYLAKKFKLLL